MSTVLYPAPIYGPVHSRRLGLSLGINLLPPDGKQCTFDCIYCECGFNRDFRPTRPCPTRREVAMALEAQLKSMHERSIHPDVLTFAGNGEPTSHPDFAGIIDDTIDLRNRYCPEAKISVLSNSTFAARKSVHDALMKVDNNILKLDTVNPDYIRLVDRPVSPAYDVDQVIDSLKAFHGHIIVQTMFLKGRIGTHDVDNTTDGYVLPWLDKVKEIAPSEVMIYTIDRETPDHDLMKAAHAELDRIKQLVADAGIPCTASY